MPCYSMSFTNNSDSICWQAENGGKNGNAAAGCVTYPHKLMEINVVVWSCQKQQKNSEQSNNNKTKQKPTKKKKKISKSWQGSAGLGCERLRIYCLAVHDSVEMFGLVLDSSSHKPSRGT